MIVIYLILYYNKKMKHIVIRDTTNSIKYIDEVQ